MCFTLTCRDTKLWSSDKKGKAQVFDCLIDSLWSANFVESDPNNRHTINRKLDKVVIVNKRFVMKRYV